MKTAKAIVAEVELLCPFCSENLTHPDTGSMLFSIQDYLPESVKCPSCDKQVLLPRKVKGRELFLRKD